MKDIGNDDRILDYLFEKINNDQISNKKRNRAKVKMISLLYRLTPEYISGNYMRGISSLSNESELYSCYEEEIYDYITGVINNDYFTEEEKLEVMELFMEEECLYRFIDMCILSEVSFVNSGYILSRTLKNFSLNG